MNPFVRAPQWSREASIEISELPLEGVPDLSWLPSFSDFPAQAAPRAIVFQAFFGPELPPPPPVSAWLGIYPDFPGRVALRTANFPAVAYTNATPDLPEANLSWHGYFDDFARALQTGHAAYFPAIAFPIPIVFGIDRTLVIHTPDEIPTGQERVFRVEWLIGGLPIPLDAPPDMRIYHLDTNGFQITDLATGPCTVYPSNTAYFRAWTPTDRGVFMILITALFQTDPIIYALPVTVRAKFDPFALANDDILVSRNGDIGD